MERVSQIFLATIALSLIFLCQSGLKADDELMHVPAAIHISSTVSDGKLSIPQIVEIARQNNIKIVILTDRDFMRWEYGLWPLRRIIRKTVGGKSIFTYGIKRYLDEVKEIQKRNPDLVLIPGAESAPFYYWSGSPFRRNLRMHNWNKHILVFGLEGVSDYKNLPSVSNKYSLTLPFTSKDIYHFWPILTLIIGILCLRKRLFKYKDLQGHSLSPYSRGWRIFGVCIIIFSLLFLFNNFPFRSFKYDQYHGEQHIGPYQDFFDYVNQRGGLTFWAHPGVEELIKIGGIEVETPEHSLDLLDAKGYTGFAVFYWSYVRVGCPGAVWDEVLKQYCQGRRTAPVWTIGGLAYDTLGDLGDSIRHLRTIFLIPRLNKAEVLKALREGKMYVIRGYKGANLVLDEFAVCDSISANKGIIGDEVSIEGKALLKIYGTFSGKEQDEQVKITVIRNGSIIKTFDVTNRFEINYQDEYSGGDNKVYYRLEIFHTGHEGMLVTNPIFVKFRH